VADTSASIPSKEKTQTYEQALCAIFDTVEDALEKLTPEKRKAWLDDLSETARRLEKQG
jgi:hypothetical protein